MPDGYDHERRDRELYERYHQERADFVLPKPCPDFLGTMEAYLERRGLSYRVALHNSWYVSISAGDDNLRVVIPGYGLRVRGYWQARATNPEVLPRYQSPHGDRGDAFVLVWPLYEYRASGLAIVEGPMDALAAAGCGWYGAAVLGCDPPPGPLGLIAQLAIGVKPVVLVADSDRLDKWATLLAWFTAAGVPARLVVPPAKDLADMSLAARVQLLNTN